MECFLIGVALLLPCLAFAWMYSWLRYFRRYESIHRDPVGPYDDAYYTVGGGGGGGAIAVYHPAGGGGGGIGATTMVCGGGAGRGGP